MTFYTFAQRFIPRTDNEGQPQYLIDSSICYLNVLVPPVMSHETPSAVEVREGHNVTLTCKAEGNPTPSVVWRRQDKQIIRYNGATGFGASVFHGPNLHLTKVNRKHMSEYVCVASNGIPPDETWTVKLLVTLTIRESHFVIQTTQEYDVVCFEKKEDSSFDGVVDEDIVCVIFTVAPMIQTKSAIVKAPLGGLARLVCTVESWPRPDVSWDKEGHQLFDSDNYAMDHPIEINCHVIDSTPHYLQSQTVSGQYHSVHVLEIRRLERNHYGKYRCTARNDNGIHFADIELQGHYRYSLPQTTLASVF
ncbi:immunoglobulin domain protein [Dictyocaulus viviparus]|uniref:Immunoglobulin domain protein n=1 Tax=Dictyocaulus viviparus TaxID=29172 RepID=A0A0D8XGK5_DICVI|nr:immunoglobulin domain protein [Dictyocaulus viviparus]